MSKHSLLMFASALLLAGCPDPEARFDEFTDRTEGERQGQGGGGPSGGIADINGRFLMGIDTVIGPGKLLEFDTTTELSNFPCTDVDCVMRLEIQPVVPTTPARSGCGPRGTPVGDVIIIEDVPVSADGSFVADFGTQQVPGCANPISGSDITAKLVLTGQIVNEDLYCGSVGGSVSRPLSATLRGSSFAAIRITDNNLPATLGACPAGGGEGGGGGEGEAGAGGEGGSGGEGEGGSGGEGGAGGEGEAGAGGEGEAGAGGDGEAGEGGDQ